VICPACQYVIPPPPPLREDHATPGGYRIATQEWRQRTADGRGTCQCLRCQKCWDLAQVRGKLQSCHCTLVATTKE
jgi:hypothetical protein